MVFNRLIPELSVSSLSASRRFYTEVLGFAVEYERAEDGFVFLAKDGSQIMLEERNGNWNTGSLEVPFGRGINFQIEVMDLESILRRLREEGWPLFREPETRTYRVKGGTRRQRQFLVQDPDGYLWRFCTAKRGGGHGADDISK